MGAEQQAVARPEKTSVVSRAPRAAQPTTTAHAAALAGVGRAPHVPQAVSPELLLMLQRTAGNAAVSRLLSPPRPARPIAPPVRENPATHSQATIRPAGSLAGLLPHLQRTAGDQAAAGPGQLRPAQVQRGPGAGTRAKDAVVGAVGTNEQIANVVGKRGPDYKDPELQKTYQAAFTHYQFLEDMRLDELKRTGHSDIDPDQAWEALPERVRPLKDADLTIEEEAVRANKADFLDESVRETAQKQRKIRDVHEGVRVRKAALGRQLAETKKGSAERAAIKAQLTVLEDADLAKLAPKAQEKKLRKAALKAQLELVEKKSKKGTVLGISVPGREQLTPEQQKAAGLAKGLIKGEIAAINRPKVEVAAKKAEVKAELAKWEKKSTKGMVYGHAVPGMKQLTDDEKIAANLAKQVLLGQLAEVKALEKQLKPKQSDEWKKKLADKHADDAATALDAGSTVAKIGTDAAIGAKEIAHETGNTAVAGESTVADGHRQYTEVGTAAQGASVESEVASLLALGSDLASISSIVKAMQEGDTAEQKKARLDAIDLGYSLGGNLIALGRATTVMAGDFTDAGTATTMAADVVPGLDIASAGLQLIAHGQQLIEASARLAKQGDNIKEAKAAGDTHIAKAIGQFKEENTAISVSSGVDVFADVLKITGAAISLSGIGIIVGHPIKFAGIAVSVLNKAAMATRGAVKAGTMQEARAADMLGQREGAAQLLKHDPKHGSQVLVREARKGNKVAKRELKALGIGEKTLAGSADESVRALALAKMGMKEDAKTIGQSLKEGVEGAEEWWHEDTGAQVEVIRKVKNKLNYGGVGDRGLLWKAKMRLLAGYDTDSTASIHKILQEMSPAERAGQGITDEEVEATATQFERELKAKEKAAPPKQVVGPLG